MSFFHLEENQTSVKQEIIAGFTAFLTVAYILVVNPTILSDAGIPYSYALLATVAVTAFGCLALGVWGNTPLILTPGMGINAFFAYTMVEGFGLTWQEGLAVVIVAGILFFIMAITPMAAKLAQAVPESLKIGITAGVGIFLTFIGLQMGEVVVPHPDTFVALGSLSNPVAITTLVGLVIMMMLFVRAVKGTFLIGMLITAGLAFLIIPGADESRQNISFEGYSSILTSAEFSGVWQVPFWTALFSLTMLIVFETLGLLHGLLPENKSSTRAYQASSTTALMSGVFGTSPTIPVVEGAAGTAAGGRTGLTAVTVAVLFLLSLLFAPFLGMIPNAAIAPILIIVGGLMAQQVVRIPRDDPTEWFPAYFIVGLIPLTSSIADGIAFGFIMYPLLKMLVGQYRMVSAWMYVIALLFVMNYVLLYTTV
ncbi:NCS2 family permease [Salsuginibacillus kocurii]|uniref:NCS2 family permease n=1 Tax=Salsuginibacillus kocurii TaxID=427078 RepID=UPI00037AFD07|nr:NCS2 family permease [Salsuginibacillus kocurii]